MHSMWLSALLPSDNIPPDASAKATLVATPVGLELTMEWTEWEQEGPNNTTRFGLASNGVHGYHGDDIGLGSCLTTYAFQSAEGRTYFKQWHATDKQLNHVAWQLECLQKQALECLSPSGRVRGNKFRKLVEEIQRGRTNSIKAI
jgi:hypothetical protein